MCSAHSCLTVSKYVWLCFVPEWKVVTIITVQNSMMFDNFFCSLIQCIQQILIMSLAYNLYSHYRKRTSFG